MPENGSFGMDFEHLYTSGNSVEIINQINIYGSPSAIPHRRSHLPLGQLLDLPSRPAATSRGTGKIERSGTSRMRDQTREFHRLARRG
jgi:hypothetical protein